MAADQTNRMLHSWSYNQIHLGGRKIDVCRKCPCMRVRVFNHRFPGETTYFYALPTDTAFSTRRPNCVLFISTSRLLDEAAEIMALYAKQDCPECFVALGHLDGCRIKKWLEMSILKPGGGVQAVVNALPGPFPSLKRIPK